jgi:hypothetical protein
LVSIFYFFLFPFAFSPDPDSGFYCLILFYSCSLFFPSVTFFSNTTSRVFSLRRRVAESTADTTQHDKDNHEESGYNQHDERRKKAPSTTPNNATLRSKVQHHNDASSGDVAMVAQESTERRHACWIPRSICEGASHSRRRPPEVEPGATSVTRDDQTTTTANNNDNTINQAGGTKATTEQKFTQGGHSNTSSGRGEARRRMASREHRGSINGAFRKEMMPADANFVETYTQGNFRS